MHDDDSPENLAVIQLFSSVTPPDADHPRVTDVSLEEWQEVFEGFKKFTYTSSEWRICDMEGLYAIRSTIFRREKDEKDSWEAFLDWLLNDIDFQQDHFFYFSALANKTTLMIKSGQADEALEFYLEKALPAMTDRYHRGSAFHFGKTVFATSMSKPQEDHLPVSPLLFRFARELFKKTHPHRKLPAEFKRGPNEDMPTRLQLFEALQAVRHLR